MGFAWGGCSVGSGPGSRQLAAAILMDHTGDWELTAWGPGEGFRGAVVPSHRGGPRAAFGGLPLEAQVGLGDGWGVDDS